MKRKWPFGVETTREKLVHLLELAGFHVDIDDIWTQKGDYRKKMWDLAVWGAHPVFRDDGGRHCQVYSWSTMTECVRYGITVRQDEIDPMPWDWEVHANM